jgi:hypothetical protein
MEQSMSERYLLVTLLLPDGSGGTPDPDETTARVEEHIKGVLFDADVKFRYIDADVEQVYPGDVVAEED